MMTAATDAFEKKISDPMWLTSSKVTVCYHELIVYVTSRSVTDSTQLSCYHSGILITHVTIVNKRPNCKTTHCVIRNTVTHCNTLPHTATHCNAPQHIAPHCTTLQHIATLCNTLQHTATHCNTLQHTAKHCQTLQHTATYCNTLQHTATYSNILQHTARHYKRTPGVASALQFSLAITH